MRQAILMGVVVVGFLASAALAKRDPDVETQAVSSREINGVKVNIVDVKTKDGDTQAQVTQYGDFLVYGLPRGKEGPYMQVVRKNTEGVLKDPPTDVKVFRQTTYVVD